MQSPKKVIMLEPRPRYIPPKLKKPVIMLERQPKKPLVTLEPRPKPMVMLERRQDYVPPAPTLKKVITLERRSELTPPPPKKLVVTLEQRKVVEPQEIIELKQPQCIAPVTLEREPRPSTPSDNTMEERFQQLLVERHQLNADMKEQLNSLQETMQTLLARFPQASQESTMHECPEQRDTCPEVVHMPQALQASMLTMAYSQPHPSRNTIGVAIPTSLSAAGVALQEPTPHTHTPTSLSATGIVQQVPISNIQIPTHPPCLATTSLSDIGAMQ